MWGAATKAPPETTYVVMRRAHETDEWGRVAVFHEIHEGAESIDEAVARGEGELDEWRIDPLHPPVRRRWWRPSTWRG
jgi:hypothetical protein